MKNEHIKGPKERIIEAAAALFAEKGYAGIGVREIAKEADVNISMISYYFNGKIGIFKSLVEDFFKDYTEIVMKILDNLKINLKGKKEINFAEKEEFVRIWVKEMVSLIRRKTNICKVAVIEFPFSVQEVEEIKANVIKKQIEIIKREIFSPHVKIDNSNKEIIIAPAILSMIFSNFLLGNIAKSLTKKEFDDDFYEEYTEIISAMIMGGIKNIHEKYHLNQSKVCQLTNNNKKDITNFDDNKNQ